MKSTDNSGVDIDHLISQAEGQIDRQLLTGYGESGLFSTGHLSDRPFYELLSVNEVPHYLFASTKRAPTIDGQPQRDSLGGYRAITAATNDRILYAVGGSDGDITGEIEYDEIDETDMIDVGSLLRSKPALLVETTDQEYRFYGADIGDQDSLLHFIREQITTVYESKTRRYIADTRRALIDRNFSEAANQIDIAREYFSEAIEWYELITHDAELKKLDTEIDSLTDRLSASRTVQSALEYAQEFIEDGDAAFKTGDISEASGKYEKAHTCLDGLDETVRVSLNDLPMKVKRDIRHVRSELRIRDFATTPTDVHQRLRDHIETVRKNETAAENTSDPKQAKANLETAVETARKYLDELQSDNIEFAECPPEGQCDGCGRPTGVSLDTEVGGSSVSVCAPCSEFGDGPLLTEDEAKEYVERLETERRLTGQLPAAVRRTSNNYNRTPTRDEALSEANLSANALQQRYGSFDDLLESLDIDPRSDLLADLQNVAEKVERQPTKEDVQTHSRYKIARFLAYFDDWESVLQAAELNTSEDVNGAAGNESKDADDSGENSEQDTPTVEELLAPVREAADTLGRPPTYQEGMNRTEFSGSQYSHKLGAWNKVLAAADLDVREALYEDFRSVADEIGMTPIRRNLEEYATYPPRLYEDCFGSIESAIKAAGFESVNTDQHNWIKNLRKVYLEKGKVPLPFDVQDNAPHLLDKIYDDVQMWDVALSKARIHTGDQDGFAERLLRELQQVGEELGHQPSRQEFDRYDSLLVTELESHFDSFEQALSVSNLDLPSRRPLRGPLDEPPDASGEIPSHTDLLRELHWLVERKGKSDAQDRFEEIGSFDVEHYELQFGSLEKAFDRLVEIKQSDTQGSEYAPRRVLVDELSQFGEFLGRAPTLIELLYYSSVSLEKFSEKFESSADLHNAAGFEYQEDLPSNKELFDDIYRVGEELGRPPTLDEYADHGQFDHVIAVRRFDRWIATLNAAGYDLLSTVPSLQYIRTEEVDRVRFDSILRLQTGFGKKAVLLDDLYRLQHQFGDEISTQLVAEYGRYPVTAYQSVFDTVDSAISTVKAVPDDAGIDTQRLNQSLRTSFSDIRTRLGRDPTREEVDALGEFISITYLTRFGSWETTLAECLESSGLDEHNAATRHALLWELDRVAETTGDTPKPGVLLAKAQYDTNAYFDTFDSWQALYEAAGYECKPSEGRETANAPEESATTQNDTDAGRDEKQSQIGDVTGDNATDGSETTSNNKTDTSEEPDGSSQGIKNRQAMIETLQDLYNDLGRIPLAPDIRDQTEYSQHDYVSEFGSLDDALTQAGYDKREAVLREVERVADDLGYPPTTVDFHEHSELSGVYTQYFESWEETVEAAGVSKEDTDDSNRSDKEKSGTSTDEATDSEETDSVDNKDTSEELSANSQDTGERQAMIETLQNLYDDLGRIPLAPDIQAQTKYSQHDFTSEFGSLDDALAEAGYDKRKELLNEIKRVADELGRPPTTVDFAENAEFSSALYARYFGTWEETLEAVGVNKEENDESDGTDKKESGTSTSRSASSEPQANGSEKRTAQDSPSNEELLEELRTLDERLETVPRWGDMNERGAYNSQTYINRFESWDDALEEAGVDKGRQLLTELRRVADEVGRTPLRSDMNEQGRYSVSMYAKFFGSWVNAVNQLDGEEASSNQQNETPTETSQIPEKDALISELNRLSNETDGLLKATDLQDGGAYEVYQYTEQFGSWDEALDEAGIDRNTQLLTEVEQVWEQLGRRPSTGEMNEYGGVSATTVTKYFDSWESACNLADPNIDSTGGFNFGTNYDEVSNQELLKAIEQLHIQIGDSVTPADVVSFTEYDEEAYRAAFGSVIEAMREAGLDV